MHPIQSHILKKLTFAEQSRYSQLKPVGIESNRFIYHLNKLLKEGVIAKTATGYGLTANGKRYVGKLSLQNFQPRFQPKIVTTIICQNSGGEYLLTTWKRQPFINCIAFPYGKIHFGETVLQAAHRELQEKTGLSATLTHCGDMYLVSKEKGEVVSHMLCHVFIGTKLRGQITPELKTHNVGWQRIEAVDPKKFVPGFLEMNRLRLKSRNKFFAELTL